jgi:hypothetical protein
VWQSVQLAMVTRYFPRPTSSLSAAPAGGDPIAAASTANAAGNTRLATRVAADPKS